jgi:hypothetical protein
MRLCRKVALVLLCLCLTVSGSGFAMTMHPAMPGSDAPACPDMDEAMSMPDADDAAVPIHPAKPGCCDTDACPCTAAHGFALPTQAVVALQPTFTDPCVVAPQDDGYASPVIAALSRPPIA